MDNDVVLKLTKHEAEKLWQVLYSYRAQLLRGDMNEDVRIEVGVLNGLEYKVRKAGKIF